MWLGTNASLSEGLVSHRFVKEKPYILVHWKGHPQSFDSWKLVGALRADVPGLVAAYEQSHQLQLLR